MDFPPTLPAWFGSSASFVALVLFPFTFPAPPLMTWPLAKLSLAGGEALTVNAVALAAVPPAVVTLMRPVVAPAGTVAVICAAVLTAKVALTPLNRTAVAPVKFAPAITTLVPTGPLGGLKLE